MRAKLRISEDNAKKNQKFLLLSSESNLSKGNENREQNKINLYLFFMPRCILPYVKLRISEDNAKKNQKFLLLSSESNLSKGNENREQNKINLYLFFMPRCILPYVKLRISEDNAKKNGSSTQIR